MIDQITSDLRPLLLFSAGAASKELAVQRDFIPAIQSLIPINLKPKTRLLMRFYKGVDRLWLFTKNPNPNKLYVDNRLNMFLSSGIVLRFMNLKGGRFMKKRLRVWYGYIKAMQLLQTNPFVLNFKDLFGKKTILLSKLRNSGIRVAGVFLRLFFNSHQPRTKRSRRIKRGIRKKYYQLEVGERG